MCSVSNRGAIPSCSNSKRLFSRAELKFEYLPYGLIFLLSLIFLCHKIKDGGYNSKVQAVFTCPKYTCAAVKGLPPWSYTMHVSWYNTGVPRMWTDFGKNRAVQLIKYHWPRIVFRPPAIRGNDVYIHISCIFLLFYLHVYSCRNYAAVEVHPEGWGKGFPWATTSMTSN